MSLSSLIPIPVFLIYSVLGFTLVLGIALIVYIWTEKRYQRRDFAVMCDGNNGFTIIRDKLPKDEKWEIDDKVYDIKPECVKRDNTGRRLIIFTSDKPAPLKIEADKAQWMDARTLKQLITNEILKFIFKVTDQPNQMIMVIMIVTCVTAFIALLIALRVFGVIK